VWQAGRMRKARLARVIRALLGAPGRLRGAAHHRPARAGTGDLRPWLLLAGVLHLGWASALALSRWAASDTPERLVSSELDPELDLLWLDDASPEPARPERAAQAQPSENAAARSTAAASSTARVGTPAAGPGAEVRGPSAEPEGDAAAGSSEPVAPTGAAAPRQLSLRDLGVGPGNSRFLQPDTAPPSARQALNQKLQNSLRDGLAAHDQKLGLGPEGPAVAAVTTIVRESVSAANTSGLLVIHTDGAGLTREVEVLEASSDSAEWERIAAALRKALAGKKLHIAPGTAGVSLQLRVVSRLELPSGADPGLAVELFGQTLKKGDGDRSARLSVLSPSVTLSEVEVPYSNGAKLPVLGIVPNILGLVADPVDVGALARRIVRAHLVALETHHLAPAPPLSPR
jgi:hypothetical protein